MSAGYALRYARLGDAERLARVFAVTWNAAYRGILPPAAFDEQVDERGAAYWHEALSEADDTSVYLALVDGDDVPVGLATAGADRFGEEKWAEVWALYVMPEFQRRGLGRRLLAGAFRALDARRYESCIIWALEDNANHGFYERLGGRAVERRTSMEWGHEVAQIGFAWHDLRAPLAPAADGGRNRARARA